MTDARYSGLDLKLIRVALQVTATKLADAMGVGSSRIAYIEKRDVVTVTAAQRYLVALATLTTNSEEQRYLVALVTTANRTEKDVA